MISFVLIYLMKLLLKVVLRNVSVTFYSQWLEGLISCRSFMEKRLLDNNLQCKFCHLNSSNQIL